MTKCVCVRKLLCLEVAHVCVRVEGTVLNTLKWRRIQKRGKETKIFKKEGKLS